MYARTINMVDADSLTNAMRSLGADEEPIVFLEITRKQIETGNVGSLVDRLMAMSDSRAHTLRLANRVNLSVSGWDFDPRELYEIPQVAKYFRLAAAQWNYWLYFLDIENDALGVFVRTQLDLERQAQVGGQTLVAMRDPHQAVRVAQYLFNGFNALAALHGFEASRAEQLSRYYADVVGRLFG